MKEIDLSKLSTIQRTLILDHLNKYKNDVKGIDSDDIAEWQIMKEKVRKGDIISYEAIDDDHFAETHLLAMYIANTYIGDNGEPYRQYLQYLGLPPDIY